MISERMLNAEFIIIITLMFLLVLESAVLVRRLEVAPVDVYHAVKAHEEQSRSDRQTMKEALEQLRNDVNVNRGMLEAMNRGEKQ